MTFKLLVVSTSSAVSKSRVKNLVFAFYRNIVNFHLYVVKGFLFSLLSFTYHLPANSRGSPSRSIRFLSLSLK